MRHFCTSQHSIPGAMVNARLLFFFQNWIEKSNIMMLFVQLYALFNLREKYILILIFLASVEEMNAQNRFNVSLELSLYVNDYAAHPLSALAEFQGGKKKRMFIRSGINANNRNGLIMGIPILLGFYTHPASKNHFELSLGTTLFIAEQLPPYNTDKKFDIGPNGIMIPLAYRRELPKGWYLRFGVTPFLSFDSEIVPSFGLGYRVGCRNKSMNS